MNAYQYIREFIPESELYVMIAEEASELAQAALKVHRIMDGTNPTPVTYEEAINNLKEEIADVKLVLAVLGLDQNRMETGMIQGEKLLRWISRLKESEKK